MTNHSAPYVHTLREAILHTTHNWPIIVLFCLTGGLLGWGVSLVWPTPYRATKELYVGLNVHRAHEDRLALEYVGLQLDNVDDYKNWQMANLNSLIYRDEFIDETLSRLQDINESVALPHPHPYWQNVSRAELRAMLHAYWRNAGKWRLVAQNQDAIYAKQAATAWQEVVVEKVNTALLVSESLVLLDQQIKALVAEQAGVENRLTKLQALHQEFQASQGSIAQWPLDQPLTEMERWSIWLPVSQLNVIEPDSNPAEVGTDVVVSELGVAWEQLAKSFPAEHQACQDYLPWLERANLLFDQEIGVLNSQFETLEGQKQALAAQYTQAAKKSLGLSADLEVEGITSDQPQVTLVRPTGLLILVGSLLGLIAWLAQWIVRIAMQAKFTKFDG